MKRKQFFAALLGCVGISKAQQWKECVPAAPAICSSENKPALNNQCPVCGELAAKVSKPVTGYEILHYEPGDDPNLVKSKPIYGEMQGLARCKRCNAGFWQDAE